MRELNLSEINMVSGGNANSNYEGGCASHVSHDAAHGAANGAYAGAVRGAFQGWAGGPEGVVAGAALGGLKGAATGAALAGAASYAKNCRNDNHGSALGGDSSRNSVNGQCHW
ncbi:hypothetical protein [Pantoea piersonii]|uniref:Uncharacterized protein n=1 Tax=Pantoea piersonii TaxID=2364647 RepID=A0AAJ5UC10_9GAMM|nr:hypothetical protein [Pantoea piersonii]WBG93127.1 hypothetical protein N5580_18760 [Pantoea piersonii]